MHKLFHITPGHNIHSIVQNGLIPNGSRGLNSKKDAKPVVWLTNNVEYILKEQAGERWVMQNEPWIITINADPYISVLKAKIAWAWESPRVCEHEFFIEGIVKPNHVINYKKVLY